MMENDQSLDVVALALLVRDGKKTMLHPIEEQAIASRVLLLEGVYVQACAHASAVELANAAKGAGDTARDVTETMDRLTHEIAIVRANEKAHRWKQHKSQRRDRPLRQLGRWIKTMWFPKKTVRSAS